MFSKWIEKFRSYEKEHGFSCDICKKEIFDYPENRLCPKCKKVFSIDGHKICPKCGRKIHSEGVCLDCKSVYPTFQKGFSPLAYEGELARAVNLFKNGKRYLSRLFAELMKERFDGEKGDLSAEELCVCYVPMTKEKERRRGYNQAKELAKEFSVLTEIPLVEDGIVKVRETKEQKGMSARERADNVKAVFRVHKRKECKGKTVILIDDIMTKGATGNEISRILLLAGAKQVLFLTVASVPEN